MASSKILYPPISADAKAAELVIFEFLKTNDNTPLKSIRGLQVAL
jgi:hypothetical protein